jgi:phage antirepressor YoqD-like protein
MYRLMMRSRKPEAAAFQAWVTDQVIPAVRRAGSVPMLEASPGTALVAEIPQDFVAALRAHADAVERQQTLEREAHVLKASLQAHDELKAAVTRIMGAGDTLTVGEAAQALCRDPRIHTGERRLFNVMARERWIYRRGGTGAWRPYQECVQRGFLEGAVTEFQTPDGETHFKVQIRVTIRGLLTLWQLLGGTGDMPDEVLALPAA